MHKDWRYYLEPLEGIPNSGCPVYIRADQHSNEVAINGLRMTVRIPAEDARQIGTLLKIAAAIALEDPADE